MLEKKTVTSSQGKILEERKSQNDLSPLPTVTVSVAETLVIEQPSEQLITAAQVNREKIRQRLQATREKLALLQDKAKITGNILLQEDEASPQPKLTAAVEEANDQTSNLGNPVAKGKNLHALLEIKAKSLAAIDAQKAGKKTNDNKNDDFTANLARESSEETCTTLLAELDPTATQVNTIIENEQSTGNIVSFPLNCLDNQLVLRQQNANSYNWENPFHHYLYADLYHKICKDLNTINQQLAERYAKALSKKLGVVQIKVAA